jgi:hypothetical protein
MQGKTSILHFAIPVCEISYILERPDGVCSVHLKNGNVIAAQESFETVTEAYEKIVDEDLGPRTGQVESHGQESKEIEY